MFKNPLWQPVDGSDIALGRVKRRWWQGIVCLGSAPPRFVLCPLGMNWIIAKMRNAWLAFWFPKQSKLDRMLTEAWQRGYSAGFERALQSRDNIRSF